MEASNPKQANESLAKNGDSGGSNSPDQCQLGFKDQCKIVWEGLKKGFSYDGCTASPDFDFGADCCGEHDFHYQDKKISRAEADKRLRECIQKKGYIVLPWIYWSFVRVFGGMFWNKKRENS